MLPWYNWTTTITNVSHPRPPLSYWINAEQGICHQWGNGVVSPWMVKSVVRDHSVRLVYSRRVRQLWIWTVSKMGKSILAASRRIWDTEVGQSKSIDRSHGWIVTITNKFSPRLPPHRLTSVICHCAIDNFWGMTNMRSPKSMCVSSCKRSTFLGGGR